MTEATSDSPRLFLLDGHSQLYRSYHAIAPLRTSQGTPTHLVFGFMLMLQRLVIEHRPKYLGVVLDAGDSSFRNELYADYKAQRDATPEDFIAQMPFVRRLLHALGLPVLEMPGFEADDILATLAEKCGPGTCPLVIVSADKDLFQLVRPGVSLLRTTPDRKEAELYDDAGVLAKMGVPPRLMVDFQGIVGDAVDNIPGLSGIGPKMAVQLLAAWPGGIDAMYAEPDLESRLKAMKGLGPSKIRSIVEGREIAFLSRELARLKRDVPLDYSVPEGFLRRAPRIEDLAQLYRELEFFAPLRELESGRSPFFTTLPPELGGGEIRLPAAPPVESAPDDFGGDLFGFGDPAAVVSPASSPGTAEAVARPIRQRSTDYRQILTVETLEEAVASIRSAGLVAFDTETVDIAPNDPELVGISLACAPDAAWYIPTGHEMLAAPAGQLPLDDVRRVLAPLFADAAIAKVAHNAKYDLRVLRLHGFVVHGLVSDTMIVAHLVDAERDSIGLKSLSLGLLGIPMTPITELIGTGRGQISMAQVPVERVVPYACADADCTLQLHHTLAPALHALEPVEKLFREVELPLIQVLEAMEARGIAVDVPYLRTLGGQLGQRLATLEEQTHAAAGHPFNLKSPKQVGAVLFDELKLPAAKKTKSGYSTDVSVLEALRGRHAVVDLMLQYRLLEKLQSTYVEALPKLVNPRTGRIHCTFNQVGAATGRLSCNEPNLQNIPARTQAGREIRRAFIAGAPDRVLLSADYSQVELRLLAHVSGDEALREAFARDADIHALTASKIFGIPQPEVSKEQRGIGKTINFGILYGMSAFRLANDLGIDRETAGRFIRDYFAGYPAVHRWLEETKEFARKNGYVTTLGGRRRPVLEISSRNQTLRGAAERVATNTPIQGAAADLMKMAMLAVERRLATELPDCLMLVQVHDELLFDVRTADADRASEIIRHEMIQAMRLDVPLAVDVVVGATWADCT